MADVEGPQEPRQRHVQSFEDPHYHDEDEAPPPVDDPESRPLTRPPARGKPSRRIPPPPRRFYEE